MFKVLFLSKIYPACHLDVNGIKPGSNSIMTDKHTTEHSKTASLGRPAKSPDLGRRFPAFSLHCRLSGFDVHFTGEIENLQAFFFR